MIQSNHKEVRQFVKGLPKQINYGAMLGINALAENVRDAELQGAKSAFTLRGSWFQPRSRFGFNVEYATKTKLKASVYTRADWLELHTEGGVKTARGLIAIPTQFVKRSKRDMITRGNKPKNIKGAVRVKFRNGKEAIVKPYNDGHGRRLVVLYWLERRAKIKKRYDFQEIAERIINKSGRSYLLEGINKALSTAR